MTAVAVNRVRGMDVATDHQDARGYYLKNVSEGSELQTTAFSHLWRRPMRSGMM